MDKNMREVIRKNRVKLLKLDYLDLTAPLLAADILTVGKHKQIKTEALTSNARVDMLLEWLDESAPKEAFPHFLKGIKNCENSALAKKIKKEVIGVATVELQIKKEKLNVASFSGSQSTSNGKGKGKKSTNSNSSKTPNSKRTKTQRKRNKGKIIPIEANLSPVKSIIPKIMSADVPTSTTDFSFLTSADVKYFLDIDVGIKEED